MNEKNIFKGEIYMKMVNSIVIFISTLFAIGCVPSLKQYPISITCDPQGAEITVRNSNGQMWFWGACPTTNTVTFSPGKTDDANSVWITAKIDGYRSSTLKANYLTSNLHFHLEKNTEANQQQQQQQQQQQTVVIPNMGAVGSQEKQQGSVAILSNQNDAEIYVDGAFVGNTPSTLKLSAGIHVLEVKKEGYSDYQKTLRVLAGSDLTIRANLSEH